MNKGNESKRQPVFLRIANFFHQFRCRLILGGSVLVGVLLALPAFAFYFENTNLPDGPISGVEVFTETGLSGVVNSAVTFSARYWNFLPICNSHNDFDVFVGRQKSGSTDLEEVAALGVSSEPGWTWIPTQPGNYVIWCRVTNVYVCPTPTPDFLPIVLESARIVYTVYPVNDAFEDALPISPITLPENFVFTLESATAEYGEPAVLKKVPARHSLWWKWKPSRSSKVQIQAAQGNRALPVEVFTGTTLWNLKRVGSFESGALRAGRAGPVKFKANPKRTYYLRVDAAVDSDDPTFSTAETIFTIEPRR